MSNRTRKNELKFFLNDDEQYILNRKFELSGLRSKSAFIRQLILYGYVYDVNYEHLREYNTLLSRISNNLNQIAQKAHTLNVIDVQRYDAGVRLFEDAVKKITDAVVSPQPMDL